jgi:hypothetical protein
MGDVLSIISKAQRAEKPHQELELLKAIVEQATARLTA